MNKITKIEPLPKEVQDYINRKARIYFGIDQPERLNEKTYYRNEDGIYPPLEAVIGCDSLNSENK
jgi:hypothetical protein